MTKQEAIQNTKTLRSQLTELFGPLPMDLVQTFFDIEDFIRNTKAKDKTNS